MSLLLFSPGIVQCAKITRIEVRQEENRYILHADLWVDAPVDVFESILLNYDQLVRINPFLVESRILSGTGKSTIVQLITKTCVVLCYQVTHVQEFRYLRNGLLDARIIPEQSDFESGWLRWRFHGEAGGTQLMLDSEVVPDFVLPPFIGPYLLKARMVEIFRATIDNLELEASRIIDGTRKKPARQGFTGRMDSSDL